MIRFITFYLLVFSFLIFTALNSNCQNIKYDKVKNSESGFELYRSDFEKIFGDANIDTMTEVESIAHIVYNKSILPEWSVNIPESNNSTIYAIGISDPHLNTEDALKQATIRAKAMTSLFYRSELNGLSEYFIEEKDLKSGDILSSVYHENNRIESRMIYNESDFSLVNTEFTKANEAIVLVEYNLNGNKTDISGEIISFAETTNKMTKKNSRQTASFRSEVYSEIINNQTDTTDSFYYMLMIKDREKTSLSYMDDEKISLKSGFISYSATKDSIEGLHLTHTLESGLWQAFSTLVLRSMVYETYESNTSHSGMTDINKKVFKGISKDLTNKVISCKLKSLNILNNNLYIDIDVDAIDGD